MGVTFRAQDLSFSFDGVRTIFSNISFTLHVGEIFCILGPNGTGKSTLLKCLIDLLSLKEGFVQIDGTDITSMPRRELAKKIAFVPQGYEIAFPYSVMQYVLMGRAPFISPFSSPSEEDVRIAMESIHEVGVDHLIDKQINEVSGGEHQMALIARALAQKPEILLLDEPTSHLDFGNQMQVIALIERLSEQGIIIIMTSHFPDHAFIVSDLVAILRNGTFAKVGPAHEVITDETLKETYQIDVKVEYVEVAGRKVCIPIRNKPGCICPIGGLDLTTNQHSKRMMECTQDVYW